MVLPTAINPFFANSGARHIPRHTDVINEPHAKIVIDKRPNKVLRSKNTNEPIIADGEPTRSSIQPSQRKARGDSQPLLVVGAGLGVAASGAAARASSSSGSSSSPGSAT